MPFYAKLEAARRASRANLRIIALSHESRDVLGGYLRAHGLAVDAMVSLTQDEYRLLKVRGTPTLILADRSRLIRQVWVGRIRPDAEPSVIAELLEESK